ncbi:amidinotransferase [Hyphobacterium sp. CCMP332]|nr:amidinotransferase [Hyphobacterium sp. CCMP332]
MMVRPASFGSNPETLQNNAFQKSDVIDSKKIQREALIQFDDMFNKLRENNFDLLVLDEPLGDALPDTIFPNNWFSTHQRREIILYPMFSALRRKERRPEFIEAISDSSNYNLLLDLSQKEKNGVFLEGTGSVVFDHNSRLAFCCESPRSNESLFFELVEHLNYRGFYFKAIDKNGVPIYHSNVMMAVGVRKTVVCLDAIDKNDRDQMIALLKEGRKDIISITLEQMHQYAGNLLLAKNDDNQAFWLMSKTAFDCLDQSQIDSLKEDGEILYFNIPVIEKYGGGSVRCMLAELF